MKTKHRWWDNAVLYLIVAFCLMFVGQILGMLMTEIPLGIWAGVKAAQSGMGVMEVYNSLPGSVLTGSMYIQFIGIWIFCLLIFLIPSLRPMYKVISTKTKGNNLKNLLIGLLIGGGTNAICVLVAYLNQDIALYFDSFHPISFVIIFVCVFVQSSAEELICRGYLMQKLLKRYKNPWIGIIGNAVLFSLLHLANDGITVLAILNIIVIGIQFSLMVYYMDSIWCAFAAHAAWNFMQNIIFGLPNSGVVVPYSVMKLDASTARDSFAYNVGFGVESTVVALVIQIAVCVAIYVWGKKNGRGEVPEKI